MFRKISLSAFAVLALATYANAGPVYLALVLDPATTAGNGVPTIAREHSTGTFGVQSTQFGAGRFHVYLLDDQDNSFGVSLFKIGLTGATFTSVANRVPRMNWDNLDENAESEGSGGAGFTDTNILSGVVPNGPLPLQGGQAPLSATNRIAGLGRTTGNLNQTPNMPAPSDSRQWSNLTGSTSPGAGSGASSTTGQWGTYATDPDPINGRSWLFLAEGLYADGTPQFDLANSYVDFYSEAGLTNASILRAQGAGLVVLEDETGVAPDITNTIIQGGINGSDPGSVAGVLNATGDLPITWELGSVSFVPSHGGSPAQAALIAANASLIGQGTGASANFSWNTVGAPRGTYTWSPVAENEAGSSTDTNSIQITITAVPEPATFALVGLALVGLVGIGRRR